MKRIISLVLAVLMISACLSASISAFTDVNEYENEINELYKLGIISGKDIEGNIYDPDSPVLRWQMALLIAKAMTGKVDDAYKDWYSEKNTTPFADVNKDQFFGSISYAHKHGIVVGRNYNTFDPDGGISYQDALTMLVRAVGKGSEEMDKGYPESFINKANELGINDGFKTDVKHTDTLSRGEVAKLIYNAFVAEDDLVIPEEGTEDEVELRSSIVYISDCTEYYAYVNYDTIGGHNQNYYEIYFYNAIDVISGETRTVRFEGEYGKRASRGFYYVNKQGELAQDPISGALSSANAEMTLGRGDTRFSRYEVEVPGHSLYGRTSRAWQINSDGTVKDITVELYTRMANETNNGPLSLTNKNYAVCLGDHYNHEVAVVIYFEF